MKRIMILSLTVCLFGCEKKQDEPIHNHQVDSEIETKIVTDTILIPDNQTIANITKGFYGFALEYKGDFMPRTEGSETTGTIDSLQTDIYIYNKLTFNSIQNARTDDYSLFWYIDSIKQTPIKIIRTNNKGFYQVELDSGAYTGLLRYDELTFYNNVSLGDGHLGAMIINTDTLIKRNLIIDFEMSE